MMAGAPDQSSILLVDDDPIVRLTIGEGIRNDRFWVFTASDGRECIDACEQQHFDLAIIDQQLPDTTGLALARTLKQKYDTPFLFLTGSDDHDTIIEAARIGALGYLVKPVTAQQVSAQLDTMLSRSREISNLGKAVEVSGIVSVALGLVMHAQQISREEALAQLHAICRPRNQSLKSLSEQLVEQHEQFAKSRSSSRLKPEAVSLLKINV